MFKPLVKYFIKKRIEEVSNAPTAVHGDMVMNVAVVAMADSMDSLRFVYDYVRDLKDRGLKTVDLFLCFQQKKSRESFHVKANEVAFHRSDFTWLGKYKSDNLKAHASKKYDLLIDLTRGKSLAADVVIAKTNAIWKAGEHDPDRSHLLDFMIDIKKDPDIQKLIFHLDQYIMNFNKSNAA